MNRFTTPDFLCSQNASESFGRFRSCRTCDSVCASEDMYISLMEWDSDMCISRSAWLIAGVLAQAPVWAEVA